MLVARVVLVSHTSPPALFRTIELARPTLLLDEADTFLKENEELRGVLNSGNRLDGAVLRCVGDDHEPRRFSTWAPVAIAAIGRLPGTIEDRCITIPLQRRAADERVERWRADRTLQFAAVVRRCTRWAQDYLGDLRLADPAVPDQLHDRAADNWRPLLAIADAAGGEWPERARKAAVTLSAGTDADTHRIMLLSDLKAIFAERGEGWIVTSEIIEALVDMDERPWGEHRRGKPIVAQGLRSMLEPFKIYSSRRTPTGGDKKRGYASAAFADAWARYLPPNPSEGGIDPVIRSAASNGGAFGDKSIRSAHDCPDRMQNGLEPSNGAGPDRMTGSIPPGGDGERDFEVADDHDDADEAAAALAVPQTAPEPPPPRTRRRHTPAAAAAAAAATVELHRYVETCDGVAGVVEWLEQQPELARFTSITIVNSEFASKPGELPNVRCLAWIDLRTGNKFVLWADELARLTAAPFPTGKSALVVSYYALAELSCFTALGWQLPDRMIDLYVEARIEANDSFTHKGKIPLGKGQGLLDALHRHGLASLSKATKDWYRKLATAGGSAGDASSGPQAGGYTADEKRDLGAYCLTDCTTGAQLLEALMPSMLEDPRGMRGALARGNYVLALGRMEARGVPVDLALYRRLVAAKPKIKARVVAQYDTLGFIDRGQFKQARFKEYVTGLGAGWPLTDKGELSRTEDTFAKMVPLYPELAPTAELLKRLGWLSAIRIAVGADGRNRAQLSPFKAKTGGTSQKAASSSPRTRACAT